MHHYLKSAIVALVVLAIMWRVQFIFETVTGKTYPAV